MFLHVGGDYVIRLSEILAIFDFDNSTNQGSDTIKFLQEAEAREGLQYVAAGLPRSFIVTDHNVLVSPISAQTLKLRLDASRLEAFKEGSLK